MDDADALEREVAAAARALGLAPGARVLVAVSGGADSVATAALLAAAGRHGLPLDLVLAHGDHGWRGPAEAAADRAVVVALAARLRAPWRGFGPPDAPRRTEDDARRFRYRALEALAARERCPFVATGHHVGDQAETYVLRRTRGAGPRGRAGIPPRRALGRAGAVVVRPVLAVEPGRLRRYALARGLAFREDPTNADLARDRARVRAALARLEAGSPGLGSRLAARAARARARLRRHEAAAAAPWLDAATVHPLARAVEVPDAVARATPRRDLGHVLAVIGARVHADDAGPWLTRAHVALVARALAGPDRDAAVDLPHGRRVARVGARVLLLATPAPVVPPVTLDGDGTAASTGDGVTVELVRHDGAAGAPADGATFRLDAARAGPRLVARPATAADVFVPAGRARAVPVQRFLARAGVVAPLRAAAWVVADGVGRVLAVVGARAAAEAVAGPATPRVACVTVRVHGPATPPAPGGALLGS